MYFSDEVKKEVFDFVFAVYRVTDRFPEHEPLRNDLRTRANETLMRITRSGAKGGVEEAREADAILATLCVMERFIALSVKSGMMKAINGEVLHRECEALAGYFEHLRGMAKRESEVWGKHGEGKEKSKPILPKNAPSFVNDAHVSINDILNGHERHSGSAYGNDSEDILQGVQPQEESREIEETAGNGTNNRRGAIIDYLKIKKEAKMADLATIFSNRFSVKTLQRDLARLIVDGVVEKAGDKRWAVYRINQ